MGSQDNHEAEATSRLRHKGHGFDGARVAVPPEQVEGQVEGVNRREALAKAMRELAPQGQRPGQTREGPMMRIWVLPSFTLGAALTCLSPTASPGQQPQPSRAELKRLVEQREQELGAAQAALASARARLARAEGKAEVAAVEGRKVLRHHEGRLKVVRGLLARGRLCSDEPLREAEGEVAVARAWLAETEGRQDDLSAALPGVIAYHEWRIRRYRSLRLHRAIHEEEAQAALKESEAELRGARGRLASLRGDSSRQGKTAEGGKP
jgi:hypothetical protein